jgi:segregation and condensation protein B
LLRRLRKWSQSPTVLKLLLSRKRFGRLNEGQRTGALAAQSSCCVWVAGLFFAAMRKQKQPSPAAADQPPANERRESPLSLSRLREAFATMLGEQGARSEEQGIGNGEQTDDPALLSLPPAPRDVPCEINPRSVVESLLFVSRPDSGPMSARELAAAMRGVSPTEIAAAVRELNELYDADQAPYRIEQSNGGYRLVLRAEFERMRDKFYGKVKEARLSPTALEVLSVLAYNQPATAEQLGELRGAPCGAALSTLVRRKLVRLDRPAEAGEPPRYSTTERFLRLFGLESLEALPRSEELEKV